MGTVINMATNETFADRLTKLRENTGKKRQEVADELEISRASLEYYEKGKRKPDIEVLAKVAKYYGVSTDYLLGLSVVPSTDKDIQFVCDYTGLSESAVNMLAKLNLEWDVSDYDTINAQHLVNAFVNGFIEDGILSYLSLYSNRILLNLTEQKAYYTLTIDYYKEHGTLDIQEVKKQIEKFEYNTDMYLFKLQKNIINFFDDFTFEIQAEVKKLRKELKEIISRLGGE